MTKKTLRERVRKWERIKKQRSFKVAKSSLKVGEIWEIKHDTDFESILVPSESGWILPVTVAFKARDQFLVLADESEWARELEKNVMCQGEAFSVLNIAAQRRHKIFITDEHLDLRLIHRVVKAPNDSVKKSV